MAAIRAKPVRTQYISDVLDQKEATEMYQQLRDVTEWELTIRSRGKPTRYGKSIELDDFPAVKMAIKRALVKMFPGRECVAVFGAYLNYYRDGEMWTPNHSHKGTMQLVISLGATRTLTVSKKSYPMTNGSAIVFGGGIHGVPPEPQIKEGRISIAVFCMA